MAVAPRLSEAAYERFVLSGVDGAWELHDGRLVEKPGMSWDHNRIVARLNRLLGNQLDERQFEVFFDGRVRRSAGTIFMPDLAVIPNDFGRAFRDRPGELAIISQPLPLVIEVWSASTGNYDVATKVPEYQRRGDQEIWLIHPYERTLTAWTRQPDGSYVETVYREGVVRPLALPDVALDLGALFAD